VAADLAPTFVDENLDQIRVLVPPPFDGIRAGEGSGGPEDLGTGDVQVTLRWASGADLDLEVRDPAGDEINYSSRVSSSGGELDRDANYPCSTGSDAPVENVYWSDGAAPEGSYSVEVVYRTSCGDLGPQTFELVVRVGGRVVLQERATVDGGDRRTYNFGFPS
jgi:hypothetical protein